MQFSGRKQVIRKWFLTNVYTLAFVSAVAWFLGYKMPWGLWLGAGAYALPEALFFWLVFRRTGALHLGQIHKGFTLGFAAKFFTAILLLSLAFYFMVSPGQVLIGFLLSIVLSWKWLFNDLEQLNTRGKR